ncbi:MAG: helix-turn-helix transcriptional regulator [Bacteroidales bacterium]|nr:helix-turn-helix transcriptional regulator [Bacteroidales bacterium]
MKTYRNNELKKRIQQICKEKGMTQTELACKIGITKATLSDSIGGDMRISTIEKIAKALNVKIVELFE